MVNTIWFRIISNTNRFNRTQIRLYLPCTDWFGPANGHCPFAVPNQSVHGKYNLIPVWYNKISKRFPCACNSRACLVEESSSPNLVKSNRNQVVFTIFNDWFGSNRKSVLFRINRKMFCTYVCFRNIDI